MEIAGMWAGMPSGVTAPLTEFCGKKFANCIFIQQIASEKGLKIDVWYLQRKRNKFLIATLLQVSFFEWQTSIVFNYPHNVVVVKSL